MCYSCVNLVTPTSSKVNLLAFKVGILLHTSSKSRNYVDISPPSLLSYKLKIFYLIILSSLDLTFPTYLISIVNTTIITVSITSKETILLPLLKLSNHLDQPCGTFYLRRFSFSVSIPKNPIPSQSRKIYLSIKVGMVMFLFSSIISSRTKESS